ncbi:MAG: hypothetical protein LQ348_006428 [Seirophora lacunosa]|nr:MAG: hypothetical protein LQ348_006428 [Seirophora lacunosa]
MRTASVLLAGALATFAHAKYILKDDYSAPNFLNMFNFDTFDDPTHGYVNYVDQATADSMDMFNVSNGQVTFGVDHTNIASGRGRTSIRLTSKAQYTHGLVILDLAHMPGSICGTWPAFWMTGPNWPHSGEIDIIEGVNTASRNRMTMHTSDGCSLAGSTCQGSLGCHIEPTDTNSFGTGLNDANGGVYAMQWTSRWINIWFFPRGREPSDISGPHPNTGTWGHPSASFVGGGADDSESSCNIDEHFKDNHIVFDTTFCGDWAGAVWGQDATCAALAGSCQDYVRDHPEAFADSYWTVNSLRVYQSDTFQRDVAAQAPVSGPAAEAVVQSTATNSPVEQGNTTIAIHDDDAAAATSPSIPNEAKGVTRHLHRHHVHHHHS